MKIDAKLNVVQPQRRADAWVIASLLAVLAVSAAPLQAEDLLETYALAKSSDPQLKIAAAGVERAQEGVIQARSALLPRVNASLGYSNSNSNFPLRNPVTQQNVGQGESRSDSKSYGADISQSLYDHANYTRLAAAKIQIERAEAQFKSAEQALLLRVAQAYFTTLTAQDALASAKAEETAVARQLEQAEQRFNVGLTAITDVHEARARYDGSVAAAILSENQLDDAKAALTELTGQNIEQISVVRETIPLQAPAPAEWQTWVDLAIKNNPTLSASAANASAAQKQIETAKSAFYPTVSASFGYNNSSSNVVARVPQRQPSTSENDGQTLGVNVNVPIFAGFANASRVRQAVSESETAKDQLEIERRTVTRQTRNAYRAVLAGVSEVKARSQALVSAKSALEATQAGFEVGTRTIVDVLLSQQVLFQAQRDYSSARHNFLVNGLRLKSSAGTIEADDMKAVNALLEAAKAQP